VLLLFLLSAYGSHSTPLRALTSQIHIGAAVSTSKLVDTGDSYDVILDSEFDLVTPENACKFAAIQATEGVYDFNDCDTLLNRTKLATQFARGHNLNWGSQRFITALTT
jgi:endo-1,4-beta-xylanase